VDFFAISSIHSFNPPDLAGTTKLNSVVLFEAGKRPAEERAAMTPDYLICLECETPCYVFEWDDDKVKEAICTVCGNDEPAQFTTEEEYEELSMDPRFSKTPDRI
jgi:hypothetical protein